MATPTRFTPESTVDVQLAFGSDILMVLDECPEYPVSHEYARESHAAHRPLGARRPTRTTARRIAEAPTRHALFPIVQGSMFADLRRECADRAAWNSMPTATPSAASRWASRGR